MGLPKGDTVKEILLGADAIGFFPKPKETFTLVSLKANFADLNFDSCPPPYI